MESWPSQGPPHVCARWYTSRASTTWQLLFSPLPKMDQVPKTIIFAPDAFVRCGKLGIRVAPIIEVPDVKDQSHPTINILLKNVHLGRVLAMHQICKTSTKFTLTHHAMNWPILPVFPPNVHIGWILTLHHPMEWCVGHAIPPGTRTPSLYKNVLVKKLHILKTTNMCADRTRQN